MNPIKFCGRSLETIRNFPTAVKRDAGHQLDRVQRGLNPLDWKPMSTIGKGVREIIMTSGLQYESVWDALEEDPVRVQNLKLRSALLIEITEKLRSLDLTQAKAAEILCINQPRVSALLQGKISRFRLDSLVDMAHRLGLNVSIQVAA